MVIADLLGVPGEDREHFRSIFTGNSSSRGGRLGLSAPAAIRWSTCTRRSANTSRIAAENPAVGMSHRIGDIDLSRWLVARGRDIVRLATFLFGAGQDTSARMMASALRVLAEDQELQAQLRADMHRIPDFIEEVLRLESPTMSDFRMAQQRTQIGGVEIPAGTTIMLHPGASNRDHRQFPDPEQFRLDRKNVREHIAFGRGVHSCPGGPLARAEGRVSVERFLGGHHADAHPRNTTGRPGTRFPPRPHLHHPRPVGSAPGIHPGLNRPDRHR